ncbi:MAG TPA: hypothetical protein ENJ33_05915 [Thiothrix sp.]|nr:hypothetical protein [Thiothrix sp.]
MKKIPYGISDFKRIQIENYYFIDKTHYIEKLETLGSSYLMFLRPRRFGKSLWLAILEAYYDVYFKPEFEAIFKDTYIFNHATVEANSYLILSFDFSAIDTEDIEESFRYDIQLTLKSFVTKYALAIIFDSDNPISMFKAVFDHIKTRSLKLYILIDEYDNFANKLLLNNTDDYVNIVSKKTALFKQFFTTLKAGTTGNNAPIKRMFITGVTPMTMYDVTSGFNIGDNLSLNGEFHHLVGVSDSELNQILDDYDLSDTINRSLLKDWYNHYIFNEDATDALYNTDMILYFIQKFLTNHKPPREMIDINVRSDYSTLRNIIYTNKKLNGNFSVLQTLIGGESVAIANLVQDFSALNLAQEHNFKSLLFYLGLISIKSRDFDLNLYIPNETVKRIDIAFLKDSLEMEQLFSIDLSTLERKFKAFALQGEITLFKYLAKQIKENTGIRDYIYNEQTVKSMYLAYLSLTPYYVIKSEEELNKGFADIFLKPFNPYVEYVGLVEFKYLKRGKKKPSKIQIKQVLKEAEAQLDNYQHDELVTYYTDQGLKLQKVVLVFWGWELIDIFTSG